MVVVADIAASVLARLRNKAKAAGISYQQCLQLFMQEEFLRKLSKSGYEDALILKGGLFIYTLTNFESRATVDVDFLLRSVSNSLEEVQALIMKILAVPTGNDYIEMTAKGFEKISPQRKYHGISTQIIGKIKNVRVPFNVDIGVGDVIVPCAEERTIHTQLPDFEAPVIMTYSLESTIAEKFDAILQRFELTGRMKDFLRYFTIWQGLLILMGQDCRWRLPEHWNGEGHPTKRTVSSVLSHLPRMWICRNGGDIF